HRASSASDGLPRVRAEWRSANGRCGMAAGADDRHALAAMLDDAHKRKFDIVLCWSLDRLSREGLEPTIGYLRRLSSAGVAFHSYLEPMLSTDNPMVRDVLLAVMASMAAMERARISERTKAGLARV